jgi:hypothetical protein
MTGSIIGCYCALFIKMNHTSEAPIPASALAASASVSANTCQYIQYAASLNSQGVDFLASKQRARAAECFRGALKVLSKACAETDLPCEQEESNTGEHLLPLIARGPPVALLRQSQGQTRNQQCGSGYLFCSPFLFQSSPGREGSCEQMALFSACAMINYALCVHQKASAVLNEAALCKARMLYEKSLHILAPIAALDCFADSGSCHVVMGVAMQNMADVSYKLGDFQGVQFILNEKLMWDLQEVVEMQVATQLANTAPLA